MALVDDGMACFHNPATGVRDAAWSQAQTVIAADEPAAQGIKIHVVTLCPDGGATKVVLEEGPLHVGRRFWPAEKPLVYRTQARRLCH